MTSRIQVGLLCGAILLGAASLADAASDALTYQGVLVDGAGVPMADGAYEYELAWVVVVVCSL